MLQLICSENSSQFSQTTLIGWCVKYISGFQLFYQSGNHQQQQQQQQQLHGQGLHFKGDNYQAPYKPELYMQQTKEGNYYFKPKYTGPCRAVGNMSGNRCESDCRSRGRQFDPGPVPYFRGD